MRRGAMLIFLLIAAGAGGALFLLTSGTGRDTAQDVAGSLGLVDDPPFKLTLAGRLWEDRTLKSEDGAPDLAYVTSDEGLAVLITGGDGARVAEVELRIDGRRQRDVRPSCPNGRCPTSLSLEVAPRLGSAGGDRHIQVIARDEHARGAGTDVGPHVSVASLTVHVGRRLPLVREGEPMTAAATPSSRDESRLRLLRARALRVLSADRSRGVLGVLKAGFQVREAGELNAGGRPLGATLLLELTPQRRNVSATVPAYVPDSTGGSYRRQTVRLRAPVLRDLLVDVDLERDQVIALEPGPLSQTQRWAPSRTSTPGGAADED